MNYKKDHEKRILEQCIRVGISNGGLCKHIVSQMQGNEFARDEMERPDFVRVYSSPNKKKKSVLIGIEHFMVDDQAQKKGKKYSSPLKENQNKLREIYDTYGERVSNEEGLEEAAKEVLRQIVIGVNARQDASYEGFLKHFRYVLKEKHAPDFEAYLQKLKQLAGEEYDTKLALLIEIQSGFRNYYVSDDRGLGYSEQSIVPLFQDLVDELKSTCAGVIDYVVLCFEYSDDRNRFEVLAVRPETIEEDIEKQGYRIYEHAYTEGDIHASMSEAGIDTDGEQITMNVEETFTGVPQEVILLNALQDAWMILALKAEKKNYVTKDIVQFLVDLLDPRNYEGVLDDKE